MNERLKLALEEVKRLNDKAQEEIALELSRLAALKRIDSHLAESEAEGGAMPHEVVFAEIKARYGI